VDRVEANRNFANKLWNAGRLVLGAVERAGAQPGRQPPPTLADRWIRARLSTLVRDVGRLFDSYQFGEAGRQIYEFFWAEYADWYLEIAKLQLDESPARAWSTVRCMVEIFDTCLRLLHPYTPFVTEELWGEMRRSCLASRARFQPEGGWEEALIVARWPETAAATQDEASAHASFGKLMDIIKAIRNARSEKGVEPSRRIAAEVSAGADLALLEEHRGLLSHLARLDPQRLTIVERLAAPPKEALPLVVGTIEVHLPMAGMVDVGAERKRLDGEIAQAVSQIERLESLLAGPFAKRAPAEVVGKERAKLEALRATRDKLEANRKGLG
jgi:valyl-tRNA synthetase